MNSSCNDLKDAGAMVIPNYENYNVNFSRYIY